MNIINDRIPERKTYEPGMVINVEDRARNEMAYCIIVERDEWKPDSPYMKCVNLKNGNIVMVHPDDKTITVCENATLMPFPDKPKGETVIYAIEFTTHGTSIRLFAADKLSEKDIESIQHLLATHSCNLPSTKSHDEEMKYIRNIVKSTLGIKLKEVKISHTFEPNCI